MSHRLITTLLVLLGAMHPALAPVSAQGQREGIKVHGHWVIDVRNPDGTLSSHVEFENALFDQGKEVIGLILGHQANPGGWLVMLTGTGPLCAEVGGLCTIGQAGAGAYRQGMLGGAKSSSNLYIAAGSPITLFGSVTVRTAGAIRSVSTGLAYCSSSSSPCIPVVNQAAEFSGTDLPSPQAVAAGQIVQVTVTISFS